MRIETLAGRLTIELELGGDGKVRRGARGHGRADPATRDRSR